MKIAFIRCVEEFFSEKTVILQCRIISSEVSLLILFFSFRISWSSLFVSSATFYKEHLRLPKNIVAFPLKLAYEELRKGKRTTKTPKVSFVSYSLIKPSNIKQGKCLGHRY